MTLRSGPIKDFVEGIYDGPHATPKEADDGPVFLGIKNVTPEGRLDFSEIRHVSQEEYPRWTRRVTPQEDDIVFSYEATLHRYALIPEGFVGCLGRRMALIRPDKSKVHPRFLHYYLLSSAWRQKVETSIISGATVDRIPLTRVPGFSISIPNLQVQARIADVLSSYDDLIENNRRRIELLEEAARQLYKEWFVRLRFPGHEHVKITDSVPEGWTLKKLGDVVSIVKDTVDPSRVDADVPYIGLEHMPRRSITLRDWEGADKVSSTKYAFRERDLLFGKIRPYFHKVGFALISGITSSDTIVMRVNDPALWEVVLCEISSDAFVALASQTVRPGSKMPRADWGVLKSSRLLIPPQGLLESFSSQIQATAAQCQTLAFLNRRLMEARDLLLPKLMSGEIAA